MSWFKSKKAVVDPSVHEQLLEVRAAMMELETLACALKNLTSSLDARERRNGGV